ncbi:MAG: hypothetical protein GOV15_02135 [Candidatus Diapherotrites archaeon]|nr:hypothetical protein [Candidatus Diapherotrites archaeon]
MFEWAKFLTLAKRFKFDKEGISFFGFNKVMVTDETLSFMINVMSKKEKLQVYHNTKRVAFEYAEKLVDELNAPPEKIVDEWGAKAFSLLGYGECDASFDFDKKEIKTSLKHNPVALSSNVKGKVDWIARGYAAGVAEAVFKEPCDCIEVQCLAEGADSCEFIAKPSKSFDSKDKLVKEQLC